MLKKLTKSSKVLVSIWWILWKLCWKLIGLSTVKDCEIMEILNSIDLQKNCNYSEEKLFEI